MNGAEPKSRTPGDFLRRSLREMSRHEKAVLSGNDSDAVHDMRVASRRLRAALVFLKRALPARAWRPASRRASRVTRAVGELRQFDVNAQLLDRLIAESAEVRPAAEFARPVSRPTAASPSRPPEGAPPAGLGKLRKRSSVSPGCSTMRLEALSVRPRRRKPCAGAGALAALGRPGPWGRDRARPG
jgi:hypothetical protein